MELAEAVEAAHQKQIVHRDLKSANVMVTSDGHVCVLDFGVARRIVPDGEVLGEVSTYSGRLTAADTTPGTVVYMSKYCSTFQYC